MKLIDFIKLSNEIHNNFYDYSLVNYINNNTKVIIICPIHGIFEQLPKVHMTNHGCQGCNKSKGELEIKKILDNKKIKYITQHKFDDCKNVLPLSFDFYISEYNCCIEYDGLQHFEPVKYWGGDETFEKIKLRDKIKTEYCKNNNIQLIRIRYDEKIIDKLCYL